MLIIMHFLLASTACPELKSEKALEISNKMLYEMVSTCQNKREISLKNFVSFHRISTHTLSYTCIYTHTYDACMNDGGGEKEKAKNKIYQKLLH